MRLPANQVSSVKSLAGFYGLRPHRIGEIALWAQHRHKSTLELRLPWWNYATIEAVKAFLPSHARVFEYGGGGSTLWLHDLGARLTSVEHDSDWYAVLRETLPAECMLIHRPAAQVGVTGSESTPGLFYDAYVHAIDEASDGTFDLVIVDGRARVECIAAAKGKVTPGGFLLLDDSDRTQYRRASELLTDWIRTDYRGAKPGGGGTVQTTVWAKEA
ncbi:class I SAM-dependent methyltransferase [Rhodococcus fascians]|nr:class I SAM-dependent methyltransferase [Rhodococcus fascians]MBY4398005.1 class I SAM-dependent methyltransferase [Rhodococcus fascians]MBY4409183.1 class I SAM-dependent methyltransferase [Rhodococcus fascians]MBY4422778.1 class I SAM-dependent methyltransferase [Rhodococcus fascians]MBY4462430.1 class I SAM-dependent methyltransferase [Rhodococcus fascians]